MEKLVAGTIVFLTFVAPSPENAGALTPSIAGPTPSQTQTVQIPTQVDQKTYKVKSGDTLDSIAKRNYGSGKYWTSLWNDNPWIEDPTIIRSGWELKIRDGKPKEIEELSEKLASIYEKLNATPTPTPTPTQVLGASTLPVGTPSSFDSTYQAAGAKYGVPWQILYGLHQMETGGRDGAISSGYGTGAQGPLQFMPQTWSNYGVDGNNDGQVDVNNAVDAIWGAANYIAAHGGVETGLKSYGGDTNLVLSYARSRGY